MPKTAGASIYSWLNRLLNSETIKNHLHVWIRDDFSILKMGPAANFGVFLDFVHPFLTEVDFRISKTSCILVL